MKKISLIALALCVSAAVYAQDNQQLRTPMANKVRFGLRAGANFATLDVSNTAGQEITGKTSFHGGVFVNAPLGGMFAIQPGVEYSGQGAKATSGATNSEIDLHYINVPVMLQLKTTGGFIVETGPQAGFLIKSTVNDVEIDDVYKTFDFSWGAGLGYVSRIGLGVNARYNLGLSNLLENGGNASGDPKVKNRNLQVGLVYHFGAHK